MGRDNTRNRIEVIGHAFEDGRGAIYQQFGLSEHGRDPDAKNQSNFAPTFCDFTSIANGYFKKTPEHAHAIESETIIPQLAADIFNQPFLSTPDDPKDTPRPIRLSESLVYRQHFGLGTALRIRILALQYLEYAKQYGSETVKATAASLTREEIECMKLAALLHNSGRTNLLSAQDDPWNVRRSAAIFSRVADNLGFSDQIYQTIAAMMLIDLKPEQWCDATNKPMDSFYARAPEDAQHFSPEKHALIKKILDLATLTESIHNAPSIHHVAGDSVEVHILSHLVSICGIVDPEQQQDCYPHAKSFVHFQEGLLRATGAPISSTQPNKFVPRDRRREVQLIRHPDQVTKFLDKQKPLVLMTVDNAAFPPTTAAIRTMYRNNGGSLTSIFQIFEKINPFGLWQELPPKTIIERLAIRVKCNLDFDRASYRTLLLLDQQSRDQSSLKDESSSTPAATT